MRIKEKHREYIYLIVLLILLLTIKEVGVFIRNQRASFGGIQIYELTNYFIFLLLGSALGFELLRRQSKYQSKWRVDVLKLVIIVMPTSVILILKCFWFSGTYALPEFLLNGTDIFYQAISCTLGFSVVTSFYKK